MHLYLAFRPIGETFALVLLFAFGLVFIIYIPVAISNVMMLYGIVSGRSLYPKWMVVFLPVIIYLFKMPVVWLLKGRLRELVNDSYDIVVLFVFYLISTVVLWNGVVI